MEKRFIGIIPARYASTRFPGKPLADLGGKPMIQHVYERARAVLERVYVATDNERIVAAVASFGGKAVMTSARHLSGTDRCCEAYLKIGRGFNVVINIQGDEPFVRVEHIELLKACFADPGVQIATLIKPVLSKDDSAIAFSSNTPKVVINKYREAMFFSRSIIPYYRGKPHPEWLDAHTYYRHIGLYAYRADVLTEITRLPPSPLELAESLEQLRWLENGYKIKVGITDVDSIGIDTPEDLARARRYL
ncbi:MAG: 3-deoxy-manno-octulosonate cytidylyltransferase [Tannerellaceae bacterium]|jgi:3-deoxy-manno-octulosonate cytidylyltransferase (CMP-KDO synthetase)|nr:3-deoxy-manno-octulosonate cytidylyltransferase [Tannerellaceae bacterium]